MALTRGLASIKKFIEGTAGVGGNQAGPPLVLRRWAEGRDAAVRGRHLLQRAQAARKHAACQTLSRPAYSERLLPRLQPAFDDAGDGKHKVVVFGSFQHNCNCVYALFRPQGGPWSIPRPPRSTNTNRPST